CRVTFVFAAFACRAGDAPAPAAAQTAPASTRTAMPPTQYLRCFIHSPFVSLPGADSDPFSVRCRWNPAQRQALQAGHREIESDPEQAGEYDARPGLVELEDPRARQDQHAEC